MAQFPSATVSFNLAPGASLGHAVDAIKAEEAKLDLPPSIETGFQGAAEAFRASLTSTLLLILAAVVTMYIVLGVLYESTSPSDSLHSALGGPGRTAGPMVAVVTWRGLHHRIVPDRHRKKNAIRCRLRLDANVAGLAPARDPSACLLRFPVL